MLDTSEMITFTEKLIEEIKHFPVLYDRKVMRAKDKLEKEEAWKSLTDRIPTDLRIKVDDTKKRWKTLKDCYSKYLRSFKTNNRFEARYQSWRWSEHMDFFKPFMLHNDSSDEYQSTSQKRVKKRKYDRRINDFQPHIINNNFKSRTNIDISHDEYVKNAQVNTTQSPSSKIKGEIDEVDDETYQAIASAVSDYENTSGGWDELLNEPDKEDDETYQAIASAVSDYENTSGGWDQLMNEPDKEEILHNSSSKSIASFDPGNFLDPFGGRNFDGLDLTFLGYASSIKKLTARRQSLIKFAVAKLIMREELAQQNENEKNCPHKATFNI